MDIAVIGEMGIANTSAASAITSAVTGADSAAVTGRGTGVSEQGLKLKQAMVAMALKINRPDGKDGLDVLAKVGGFEIGGMAGILIGCAARRLPVVLDGFIAGAAALIAWRLCPAARDYWVAGHQSAEPGHAAVLRALDMEPLLRLNLALGEGTGAALALPLLDSACALMEQMATFDSAGVSGRKKDKE
jgi:nicotinate-nucleotide--dimethylbenzimidazole phosphoribosyltransferase